MGMLAPSLHRESTDSLIHALHLAGGIVNHSIVLVAAKGDHSTQKYCNAEGAWQAYSATYVTIKWAEFFQDVVGRLRKKLQRQHGTYLTILMTSKQPFCKESILKWSKMLFLPNWS